MASVPLILNGQFFKIIPATDEYFNENDRESAHAQCQLCPNNKVISGSGSATGNFYLHLRRKHPFALKKLETQKANFKRSASAKVDGSEPSQKVFVTPFQQSLNRATIGQEEITMLILNYLEDEMLPTYTVEKTSFRKLVAGLSRGGKTPSRLNIKKKMEARKETIILNLKNLLKEVNYVCTTADIWSTNNKSYLGVTCHYLDKELIRKSAVLACKRIKFSHTHKEIGDLLYSVHKNYHLSSEKISGTVTDNASNFVKSFQVYRLPESVSIHEIDFLEDSNDTITIEYMPKYSRELDDDYEDITLPQHYRCISHTLNLIATKDTEKAFENNTYKKIYNSTVSKLTVLWNKSHRSTKAADEVEAICNCKLIVPCVTRWNSFYDSICKILCIKDSLSEICEKLCIPKFKNVELEFLNEYKNVMKTVASVIDILQGEHNCYLGYVLPVLFQIRSDLEGDTLACLSHCDILRQVMLDALNRRFKNILDFSSQESKPYLLATITIPKFKLRWLTDAGVTNKVKNLLLREATSINTIVINHSGEETAEDDEFFKILCHPKENQNLDHIASNNESVEIEVIQFLQDKCKEIQSVLKYKSILAIFEK